jgi:integrase
MKNGFRVKEYKHDRYKFVVRGKVAGKWERRYFVTKGEATTYAQQQNTLLLNEGRRGVEFPAWLRLSAERAYETLLPWGKTIEDALHFYVSHLEKAKKSAPLHATIDELIKVRGEAGVSDRYCYDLKLRLGRFSGDFSGKTTADISTADIDSWLAGLGVSPVTRNTYRRDLRTLFSFCLTRGYCSANPVTGSQRAKEIGSPIGILLPEQLSSLLKNANPLVVPYIAIGAFAGLRAAEIERLDWADVDLVDDHINVTAKNSKTATRRLVDISPNLSLWLVSHARPSGPVVPANLRALLLESRADAKIETWPPNALRHSFASYHLAHFKDAAKLALQLGHTHTQIIFQHYRQVVKPAAAERYWQIKPPVTRSKILRFAGV